MRISHVFEKKAHFGLRVTPVFAFFAGLPEKMAKFIHQSPRPT
jgi:hypothetical protein